LKLQQNKCKLFCSVTGLVRPSGLSDYHQISTA